MDQGLNLAAAFISDTSIYCKLRRKTDKYLAIVSVFLYHILSYIALRLMPKDPEAKKFGKEAAMPTTHKCAGRAERQYSGRVQHNQPPGWGDQ